MAEVRIGLLGAAKIAPSAIIEPARQVDRVEVVAVAARDVARAQALAAEHAIPRVHGSYEALLAADDVDAVYNALPPAAHAPWTIAAVQAGKHVLCEKPFSCNAGQAATMVEAAVAADRVLVEAHHWRYHPLVSRLRALLDAGRIGRITSVEGWFCAPVPDTTDFRHRFELGGGALMDLGCYAVQWVRFVAGSEPEVVAATAVEGAPGIDLRLAAELRFAGGVSGRLCCDMSPDTELDAVLRVTGDAGSLEVRNPVLPHIGHSLKVTDGGGTTNEVVEGKATYVHQLEAFVAAVLDGTPTPTGGQDAIATMAVIDACYKRAGLPRRGS